MNQCPYKIGDKVKFTPSEHTRGWYQDIFATGGMEIGEEAIIERIEENIYLYFSKGRGGWPHQEFTLVESTAKRDDYYC